MTIVTREQTNMLGQTISLYQKSKNTVRENKHDKQPHAIVIGGGIAGLLAVHVLTKYFEQVTIIERDRYPERPEPRQGVPQSHQTHALLARGQRIFEELFPGLQEEIINQGTQLIDFTADCPLLLLGHWTPRFTSDIISYGCTRNLLEATVRNRLANNNSIKFLEKTLVTNLLADTNKATITGVQIQNSDGSKTELNAQLVVDASGRNSKASQWLQMLGYEIPKETKVNSFLGYATRFYESLSDILPKCKALYIMPQAPKDTRGGTLYQIENGHWMVCLIGVGRDYPPTDETGFLNFARSLKEPEIYNAIADAKPLTPIYGYQRTENCWRHYEQLSRIPENFIVLGDAACTFNPVYGQGMTVAALGAVTLDRCLKQHNRKFTGFALRFQKQLARVNTTPWLMATSDDFRWSTTQGGRPNLLIKLMHWYLDQVMHTASKNAEVYKVFAQVMHLLEPTTKLFQLNVLVQVLLNRGLRANPEK
ncbi:FAD-dependent oxidoreductase [Iningainema tapete]|nr:FAD-dependent monooxygenase [Iningainema tapete]